MKKPNFYSSQGFDRLDRYRDDPAWLESILSSENSRLLPVWRNQHLVTRQHRPVSFPANRDGGLLALSGELILLGSDPEGVIWLALDISHLEQPEKMLPGREAQSFRDLRIVGPLIDRHSGALLAHARAMTYWHRHHRFCGDCGSPTESTRAGHMRICGNPACQRAHHPRTDPAVIMLIHDGDYCLLGRQPSWPPGMHSTLAGFVEPGESLEDAVAREVSEEAGIRVTDIRYHSSQPWPFPSSIMLGFYARAASTDIQVYGVELESAGWFHRDQLLNSPENEQFHLPRRDSISWRLIETWMHSEQRD
ncbi:NAD(+) diphosphatase [Sedimenticola selenatireducens]|uniref:NAD(+) diphosphatase n=1 Tax=Sedimenticola selenatireducens TaxID=191960 RepID=A0A2N6D0W7_9GAMM|nr:NAD(+) diphosphatase [Sedimenticola selenatireducens]PLX63302.1 MAG: NAD(+) diphosphatase [Sedimenticola selenatireducens]